MTEKTIGTKADYPWGVPVSTRWADNDIYGHINNVAYYAYFDSVVNRFMIEEGGLDIHRADIVGVIVESGCRYHQSAAYPETLEGRIRITKLGNSSVHWQVGIFREGQDKAIAEGHFIHVFVTRDDMTPTPVPAPLRVAMLTLLEGQVS